MTEPDAVWAMYVARHQSRGPIPQETAVALDAVTGFLRHQAADRDTATAREQATIEAAWTFASAWRAREPDSAYPTGVPALPAIRGMHIAEDAIDSYLNHQQAGQTPLIALRLAVQQAEATHTGGKVERELDQAVADAPEDLREANWHSRDLGPDEPEPDIGP